MVGPAHTRDILTTEVTVLEDGKHLIHYPEVGIKLIATLNTPKDELLENVRQNTRRGLQQIWPHKAQDTVLGICAGGPSLLQTLDEAKALVAEGGKLVALANVAHVLLENGITPSAQVILDAKPRNVEFLRDMAGCTYFVASQVNPAVFDRLDTFTAGNQRVLLWHAINNDQELEAVMRENDGPWCPVQSGSTITLRALRLFQILGYSKFHVFGMDSCYIDGLHHAYEQRSADKYREQVIQCNGRHFAVSGWMLNQALEFIRFARTFGADIDVAVHGDGLIAHMIRSGAELARKREEAA